MKILQEMVSLVIFGICTSPMVFQVKEQFFFLVRTIRHGRSDPFLQLDVGSRGGSIHFGEPTTCFEQRQKPTFSPWWSGISCGLGDRSVQVPRDNLLQPLIKQTKKQTNSKQTNKDIEKTSKQRSSQVPQDNPLPPLIKQSKHTNKGTDKTNKQSPFTFGQSKQFQVIFHSVWQQYHPHYVNKKGDTFFLQFSHSSWSSRSTSSQITSHLSGPEVSA